MAKVVAVHSWRGGTGKSTVVARLGSRLADQGLRVAMVDASLHAPGLHDIFGLDAAQFRLCLWDYLSGRCEIEDARIELPQWSTGRGALFLVPARTNVDAIVISAASGRYDAGLLPEGFGRLSSLLELDILLVDTHPGANHEAMHCIASADIDLLVIRADTCESRTATLSASIAAQLGRVASVPRVVVNMVPPAADIPELATRTELAYAMPVAGLVPRAELRAVTDGRPDELDPYFAAVADELRRLAEPAAERPRAVDPRCG